MTIQKENGAYQNIARAHTILDALASAESSGLRMTDVVAATGLNKSAVHRTLIGLATYGLANHDELNGRFYLGDQIFAWMHKSRGRFALADRIQPHLKALADDLEDTVNFSVRRGDFAVCLARAEGRSPIQFLTLNVGDSRPIGAGSGTLAIGSFLSDTEIERIIEKYDADRMRYGITKDMVRKNIALTRKRGYSLHEGLTAKEMLGLGVPIRNNAGNAVASFSVVALQARLQSPRREKIISRLKDEVALVESKLNTLLAEL